MPRLANELRVVVSSPADVSMEREAIIDIVEAVNQSVAKPLGVVLSHWVWTQLRPQLHPIGTQHLIDESLPFTKADVLVGIFGRRLGTPVNGSLSGSKHEIDIARTAWRKTGRPQLMIYFRAGEFEPSTTEEAEQWRNLQDFKAELGTQGIYREYGTSAEFERQVYQDLCQFVSAYANRRTDVLIMLPFVVSLALQLTVAGALGGGLISEWLRSLPLAVWLTLSLFITILVGRLFARKWRAMADLVDLVLVVRRNVGAIVVYCAVVVLLSWTIARLLEAGSEPPEVLAARAEVNRITDALFEGDPTAWLAALQGSVRKRRQGEYELVAADGPGGPGWGKVMVMYLRNGQKLAEDSDDAGNRPLARFARKYYRGPCHFATDYLDATGGLLSMEYRKQCRGEMVSRGYRAKFFFPPVLGPILGYR